MLVVEGKNFLFFVSNRESIPRHMNSNSNVWGARANALGKLPLIFVLLEA